MASDGVATNSRLAQMQMKFQQKQLREREHRRLGMNAGTIDMDAQETTNLTTKVLGNGKVRQMFHDRRRGMGIDRSSPLKPILRSTINSGEKDILRKSEASWDCKPAVVCGKRVDGSRRNETSERIIKNTKSSTDATYTNLNCMRGKSYETNRIDEGDSFSKSFTTLSLRENRVIRNTVGDHVEGNMKASSRSSIKSNIKLKPVITKKSPPVANTRMPNSGTSSPSTLAMPRRGIRLDSSSISVSRKTPTTNLISQKNSLRKIPSNRINNKTPVSSLPPPAGMGSCKVCHRNFNDDRLAKHEEICQKMANSKRKIFDASTARIKGTEAEAFVKKPPGKTAARGPSSAYVSAGASSGGFGAVNSASKSSNWRKKHEEFITAIRAAKQLKIHLARGGKLSDLPPPPPSENPDYIQCPHCLRRFNEAAAERHIPKCATMLHNKPKPGTTAKKA